MSSKYPRKLLHSVPENESKYWNTSGVGGYVFDLYYFQYIVFKVDQHSVQNGLNHKDSVMNVQLMGETIIFFVKWNVSSAHIRKYAHNLILYN